MNSLITQPSYSFSFQLTHRKWLALSYTFFAFSDIITTYFGITYFGLVENVPWTAWLLENHGWNGVLLRTLVITFFLIHFYRFVPTKIFNFVKYPSWVILFAYVLGTTVNNIYLMVS